MTANRSYIADLNLANAHLQIPLKIFKAISFFITIQLLIHLVFCLITWLISIWLSHAFKIKNKNIFIFSINIWLFCIFTLIVSNAYYFPNSAFSVLLYNSFFISLLFKFLLFTIIMVTFVALLFSVNIRLLIILILLSSLLFFGLIVINNYKNNNISYNNYKNIIIIGIDSLRPDFLSYFGHEASTPFIDSFLENATVFGEALTPLARTFPSWTSILTGAYPKDHGVRTNLTKQNKLSLSHTLPNILKQQGYKTIYASDEARFSNIDEHFGFNEVITPPMGMNDFLIGTLNDFPLSNLIMNTAIGSWLFPYNYANRASYINYDPDSFLKRLSYSLQKSLKWKQPLFLSVHFCLPHAPYSWKDLPEKDFLIRERYQASIERVDTQLKDFFDLLQKKPYFR